jgi:hypothetical protein
LPVPEPIKLFVSYRRADTQHVAGRFADKVSDRFQVFMDIDAIPPGVDFTDYLRRAVGSCDVLLAFVGDRWAEAADASGHRRLDDPDDWVAEEIRTALARKVRVIPVLVDGAALPDPELLPASLRPLTSRQALPLRHSSFSADTARLITAVQAAAAEPDHADAYPPRWEATPPPPAVQVVLAAPERPRRPGRLLVGFALALALVTLVVSIGLLISRTDDAAGSHATTAAGPSERSPAADPPLATRPIESLDELRAHLPSSLRASCRELAPQAEALRDSLRAAVQCTPSASTRSPHYVFYFAYRDLASAQRAFRSYYASAPLAPGDCRRSEAELRYERQGGRPATGTLVCYADADGLRVVAWTSDEFAVLASGADRDLQFDELRGWWELAGPIPGGR